MSDPRIHTALTAPDVERIVNAGHRPSLIDASLASAKLISDTMTGVIQPQIDKQHDAITKAQGQIVAHGEALVSAKTQLDAHGDAITKAQGQIGTQGEALASAKTRLDAQQGTPTGVQGHLTNLAQTTAAHDQAITFALLGEEGHIRRLDRAVYELSERVAHLEHPRAGDTMGAGRDAEEQARELGEVNEALRERVTAMEDAIRQLLARGPQGGGPRSPRRS